MTIVDRHVSEQADRPARADPVDVRRSAFPFRQPAEPAAKAPAGGSNDRHRLRRMTSSVVADWAKAHLDNPTVRFVEVDVDTTAYEQGRMPGAVAWDWTSQLADGIRRDIASRPTCSQLFSRWHRPRHAHRHLWRQQQLVRRLGLLAAQAVRPQASRW